MPEVNQRSLLGYVAFALVLYVVFDGFNHGMFDIKITHSLSMTAVALLFAAFLVSAEALVDQRWPLRRPYAMVAILTVFVVYVFFSAWWSGGTFDTSFVKNLLLVLLLISLVEAEGDLRWVFAVIAAAGLWQFGLGVTQIMSEGGVPVGGLSGVLPNHVQYAMYMALSAFAFLPFIGAAKGAERVPSVFGAALLMLGVMMSLARGVVVGAGVAMIVAVLFLARSRRQRLAWIGGILVTGFGLTIVSNRLGTIIDIPFALSDPARLDVLLNGRLPLLVAASSMFLAHPLLGIGYGQFPSNWTQYVVPELGNPWIRQTELAAHSTYLQIMAEMGIIGIVLYVSLFVSGMTYALRAVRGLDSGRHTFLFYAAVATFVGLLALAVHGLLDNTGWHDRVFYVYLALSSVLVRFTFRDEEHGVQ